MKVLQLLSSKYTIRSGRFFEILYQTPLVGEFVVRSISRVMGKILFYSPWLSFYRSDTMSGIRKQLVELTSSIGIPISVIQEGEKELQFLVHQCPYRYIRSDQQGVCDAIMDVDRSLFKLCGAELIIQESMVHGAPDCKILLRKL